MKHVPQSFFIILCIISMCIIGCGDNKTSAENETRNSLVSMDSYSPGQQAKVSFDDPGKLNEYVKFYNDLALDIFNYNTTKMGYRFDIVFGPYSFLQVLGMTSLGARNGTLEEMQKVFSPDYEAEDWNNMIFQLENAVREVSKDYLKENKAFTVKNFAWGHTNYRFSRDYLDKLVQYYSPELSVVDFKSLNGDYYGYLSNLLRNSTSSHLSGIFPGSDTANRTRLVLGNIMWLEDKWGADSDNAELFYGVFQTLNEDWTMCLPMVRKKGRYSYYKDDTITAFEFPIGLSGITMTVFMPGKNYFESFSTNMKERISVVSGMMKPQDVEIVLPEFVVKSYSYDYDNGLANLYFKYDGYMKKNGIKNAFDEKTADLSGINNRGYCYIKDYFENSSIGFSEKALYAGSINVVAIEATPDEPDDLWSPDNEYGLMDILSNPYASCWIVENSDMDMEKPDARPFIFLIRDSRTNMILFIGRVLSP